jgi:hypothetical protein
MFVSVETQTPVYSAPTENEETYRLTAFDRVRRSVIRGVHACTELGTEHFECVVNCGLINSKN